MVNYEAWDDAELLAAAVTDVEAFGVSYRRHARIVLAAVARRTGDPELAADVASEAFAAALTDCRRFDPARGTATAWLFGIVGHTLSAAARRGAAEQRARRRLGMDPVPAELDDLKWIEALVHADVGREAMVYLEELPEAQKRLLRGRLIDERSYADLARDSQLPEATVRKRVSRGLSAIRNRFENQEDLR